MGSKGFPSALAPESCLVVYFGYFGLSQQQVLLPLFYSTLSLQSILQPFASSPEFVFLMSVLPLVYKLEKNL